MSETPASAEPAPASDASSKPASSDAPANGPMKIEAKLGWNVFKLDKESHIEIDQTACRERCSLKPCLHICPANLYTLDGEGNVKVDFEGCLECGSCLIVCPEGALTWKYPKASQGVMYKFC